MEVIFISKVYSCQEQLKKQLSFYDFDNCSVRFGSELCLALNNNFGGIRYCDVQLYHYKKDIINKYYKCEKILLNILSGLFNYLNNAMYIINYSDKWIKNKRISPQMNKLLIKNSINDKNKIFYINSSLDALSVSKSIFRYNTFAAFASIQKEIIITPTDHLDVFISSKENLQESCPDIFRYIVDKCNKYDMRVKKTF